MKKLTLIIALLMPFIMASHASASKAEEEWNAYAKAQQDGRTMTADRWFTQERNHPWVHFKRKKSVLKKRANCIIAINTLRYNGNELADYQFDWIEYSFTVDDYCGDVVKASKSDDLEGTKAADVGPDQYTEFERRKMAYYFSWEGYKGIRWIKRVARKLKDRDNISCKNLEKVYSHIAKDINNGPDGATRNDAPQWFQAIYNKTRSIIESRPCDGHEEYLQKIDSQYNS